MSTTTDTLELFKYDLATDGSIPFNIQQALNDNWDKLDAAIAALSSRAKIQTGSYTGTGTYGQDNPCKITFDYLHIIDGIVS